MEVNITQSLVQEISIKDVEGRVIQHEVAYEWKPSFCEKCQKLGHQCNASRRIQQWQPKKKPPDENTIQSLTKPYVKLAGEIKETNLDPCTIIKSNNIGKSVIQVEIVPGVNCANGFEALEILNDLLIATSSEG